MVMATWSETAGLAPSETVKVKATAVSRSTSGAVKVASGDESSSRVMGSVLLWVHR